MNGLIKWLIIGALGLYVLSPVDLAPDRSMMRSWFSYILLLQEENVS